MRQPDGTFTPLGCAVAWGVFAITTALAVGIVIMALHAAGSLPR